MTKEFRVPVCAYNRWLAAMNDARSAGAHAIPGEALDG